MYEDSHLEMAYEDRYGDQDYLDHDEAIECDDPWGLDREDYEPSPYDGTYSEE